MRYVFTICLVFLSYAVSANDYEDMVQRFNYNASQQMKPVVEPKTKSDLVAHGKSLAEAQIIVDDLLLGMSRCVMYGLASLPKEIGEQMMKDIADGMPASEAKAQAEQRWATLTKQGHYTLEQRIERVERSHVVQKMCTRNVKKQLDKKYQLVE